MNRYSEIIAQGRKVQAAWKAFYDAKYDCDLANGVIEDAYKRAQEFRNGGRLQSVCLNTAKEWEHKAKVARKAMVKAWINIIRVL